VSFINVAPLQLGEVVPRTYSDSPFAQLAQNTAGEILVDFVRAAGLADKFSSLGSDTNHVCRRAGLGLRRALRSS
jgi:hypothetical protein